MVTQKAIWPFVGIAFLIWSILNTKNGKVKWLIIASLFNSFFTSIMGRWTYTLFKLEMDP